MRTQFLMLIAAVFLGACATSQPVGNSAGQPRDAAGVLGRAELKPKVSRFVDQIAALEPAVRNTGLADVPATERRQLLPGWGDKVCPQVTGLPQPDGEFILGRVSEIARAAGVPLAGESCSPSLFIFVTAHAKELLNGMKEHSFALTFGPRAEPTVIDQFISMPRPVKVWYNINAGIAVDRAVLPFTFAFSRVTVIVDETRLRGVTRGQLADYIALVGLAEIRTGARLGDAPSILALFERAPQAAPAGMSDWDQAFLKALYSNAWSESWKYRQDELTLSMVSQIVP